MPFLCKVNPPTILVKPHQLGLAPPNLLGSEHECNSSSSRYSYAQQFLHSTNVITALKQLRYKTMVQCTATDGLIDPQRRGLMDFPLQCSFARIIPAKHAVTRVSFQTRR